MNRPPVTILTETDLRALVPLDMDAIDCVERAFVALATQSVAMPPILRLDIPEHRGEVDVKTAYIPGLDHFAIKISPGFFGNPALGLPSTNGMMVVLSARTGLVEALLLDNGYLTDVRTAAAGAVAAKHLARDDASVAAILGAGMQARMQLSALAQVRGLSAARVWARDPAKAATLTAPFRLVTSLDQVASGTPIDAIVNLAGEPIADGLWTTAKRRRILRSRLKMTRDVVRLIARLETKPALLVSGSAVGWYGLWQDEALTKFDGGKACFTRRLCESWERMAMRAQSHGVRVVRLRIGLVLGTEGGLLSRMLTPFEFGFGGPMGNGRQWMSWIERDDLVRLIAHVIATPKLCGAVNATAPVPVRNADFARELGRAFHRPAIIPIPAFALRLLGDLADELLLGGLQVLPDKALASGFTFRHDTLRSALAAILPRQAMRSAPRPLDSFRVATPGTKV